MEASFAPWGTLETVSIQKLVFSWNISTYSIHCILILKDHITLEFYWRFWSTITRNSRALKRDLNPPRFKNGSRVFVGYWDMSLVAASTHACTFCRLSRVGDMPGAFSLPYDLKSHSQNTLLSSSISRSAAKIRLYIWSLSISVHFCIIPYRSLLSWLCPLTFIVFRKKMALKILSRFIFAYCPSPFSLHVYSNISGLVNLLRPVRIGFYWELLKCTSIKEIT